MQRAVEPWRQPRRRGTSVALPAPGRPPMLDLFFRSTPGREPALLFAAAWLTAKTVNTVVGAAHPPAADGRPRRRVPRRAAPAAARPPLVADRLYALIGQEPPRAAGHAVGAAQAPARPQNCDDRERRAGAEQRSAAAARGRRDRRAGRERRSRRSPTSARARRASTASATRSGARGCSGSSGCGTTRDATGNGFRVVGGRLQQRARRSTSTSRPARAAARPPRQRATDRRARRSRRRATARGACAPMEGVRKVGRRTSTRSSAASSTRRCRT